jgi:hypothetical protein
MNRNMVRASKKDNDRASIVRGIMKRASVWAQSEAIQSSNV